MFDFVDRLLCRLRLHNWHKFNGVALEVGGRIVGATYKRRCTRCGKTEDAWMSL